MNPSEAPRRQPVVLVHFSMADRHYEPLQTLAVRYTVEGIDPRDVKVVERSVLWYTEGKGEEDLGVHRFERPGAPAIGRPLVGEFSCPLPLSPLSYEGLIVKIRWCVRIRLFFAGGRDFVSEHIFDLGDVPVAAFPGRP
ncbi:MAG: hypothetical protein FJ284_01340 [Planctomycetes bacterium]|nr:hypothetical protein [Planctomycetota bacterium]